MDNLRFLDVFQCECGCLFDINMDIIVNVDNFDLVCYYVEIYFCDYWICLGDYIRIYIFIGFVIFFIFFLCIFDVFWFVLYWLQVLFFGLNGVSFGRLYVFYRVIWDNEVNIWQWGCLFYVFSVNKCGWEVFFIVVLIYLGVYFIMYFFVFVGIVQSIVIIIVFNFWYFWKIWVVVCLVFWIVCRVVLVVWYVGSFVWIIFDYQCEFMKEVFWRRRYFVCFVFVIFLILCLSCYG